jgi:NAD(P)-dependent dehydrogenase (short-subunit alcohol dehydrogenase family)
MKTPHQERVTVVVGGARGIGLATGHILRDCGWKVVLADLDGLDGLADAGFDCAHVDVTDTSSVDTLLSHIAAKHGRLDGLVNTAGFNRHARVEEIKDELWTTLFDVHLGGTLRLCRAAYPLLRAAKGAVVNFSSINSRIGRPRRAPYAAAKAGVEALTRTLAVEWADAGIRVNAVVPGIVNTRLVQNNIAQGLADRDSLVRAIPLKRMAEPEELGNVVEFLLSNRASYITGQAIFVDGGATINGDW